MRSLALYGQVGPLQGVFVCLGICLALMVAAKIWLKYFRLGPSEWLLRWAIDVKRSS
jgi:uncharacterized membrane protein YeiB